ncbi:MAG: hypothetical protein ABJA10_10020 [Aestuariivirga sp.]
MTHTPDDFHEGFVSEDRAQECFVTGLQAMREMLARFVEQGGDKTTAMSIRANWHPDWGIDPGKPEHIAIDCWGMTQELLDKGYANALEIIKSAAEKLTP